MLNPKVANKVATAATNPFESWQLKVKTISFTADMAYFSTYPKYRHPTCSYFPRQFL